MWEIISDRLPTNIGYLTIVLAYVIPYTIEKINQKLHKDMDPPWKG